MLEIPQALLFVYAECGPDISEAEFNDWHDNEQVSASLTTPGFSSAARYKAADSRTPTWLTLYEMTSPAIAQSQAYEALRATATANERSVVSKLLRLNRRIYTLTSTTASEKEKKTMRSEDLPPPGKVLLVGHHSIDPAIPDAESEFNKWSEEELIPGLAKVPGWLRSRRYKIIDHVELAGPLAEVEANSTPLVTYLVLHEWDDDAFLQSSEFKSASVPTTRGQQVLDTVTERDIRFFRLYKVFSVSKDSPETSSM